MSQPAEPRIHPTAIVEPGVQIGSGTSVWDSVHIRRDAVIGQDCIIGEKSYLAYEVRVGDRVKINAMVYVCYGVTLHDGVMLSAGVTFTNDLLPRATTPDLTALRDSAPDEQTLQTTVADGATIGARAVIGPGLCIGRFAMIGMGSVVTRDVGAFELVVGNPARSIGFVCRCGERLAGWKPGQRPATGGGECPRCGRRYRVSDAGVEETA